MVILCTTELSCRTDARPPATLLCYRMSGSLAALLQAGIGNVVAGSLFATAQTAAMGGGIPVLFSLLGGGVTGALGAIFAAIGSLF